MINYMKLIVGLGNPGKEYEHTRHNMGYDVVDLFASSLGFDIDKVGFKGLYTKVKYFNEDIILLKPTTYMNLSGDSIVLLKNYFKIDIEDIIIIYDDMDTKVGNIRLKIKGSSGGHNGIKSIIANLKTEEFKRIRVGIGKPVFNIIDYSFSKPFLIDITFSRNIKEHYVGFILIYSQLAKVWTLYALGCYTYVALRI